MEQNGPQKAKKMSKHDTFTIFPMGIFHDGAEPCH